MPQMAPISWLLWYIIFIMIFIAFIIMNYYTFLYPPKTYKTMTNKPPMIWKW